MVSQEGSAPRLDEVPLERITEPSSLGLQASRGAGGGREGSPRLRSGNLETSLSLSRSLSLSLSLSRSLSLSLSLCLWSRAWEAIWIGPARSS